MKKLEIKLRHFEELETIMDREKEAVSEQHICYIETLGPACSFKSSVITTVFKFFCCFLYIRARVTCLETSRHHKYILSVCLFVRHAARAAAAAAPDRETDVPHGAAETGRDEGSPAKGAARAAGIHSAAFRSDHERTHQNSNTLQKMTHHQIRFTLLGHN